MKRWWFKVLILVLFIPPAVTAGPLPNPRIFMDGVAAYHNGDWPAAIAAFKQLADKGVDNGKLCYNLGNAYLKNNDLGHALLWYERALMRMPDDPDLRFNYHYALTLTTDERSDGSSPLLQILFFWKYQLSPLTIRWLAIGFNAALWIALALLAMRKKRLLRPLVMLFAASTVIFTATAVFNYVETAHVHHAVILPDQVAVRSGFTDSATQLFVLHAGTRVRVVRQADSHLLIRYTEDKIGWIRKSEAGII